MTDFLRIDKISKQFGQTRVLANADISIGKGEFLVLVGPSGCGKTTLLNIIAGLEQPSGGTIYIDGEDVGGRPPSERDIAMVFQSYALYPNMNVAENIAFGMEMRGVPRPQREQAVAEAAKTLHIEALLKRKPSQLSGGQRQRVAMGRALVRHPRIFLFDEPLSNLDAKLRVDMRTEIKRLHQSMSATIVYVTHDQTEAMTLATRIAVMEGGVVRQLGTPAEIYGNPRNIFVASFMGSPTMNLLPAVLHRDGADAVINIGKGGEASLRLPGCSAREGDVILGLRPEHVTEADNGVEEGAQTARVRVEVVEPSGADTYIITDIQGEKLTARVRADYRAAVGDDIPLACDMTQALLFDPISQERID